MLEVLLSLLLFIGLLAWLTQLIGQWQQIDNKQRLQIYHFHHLIEFELQLSISVQVNNNQLHFIQHSGDVVSISFVNQKIRRQVNYTGHEELLRNIRDFHVDERDKDIVIMVNTNSGEYFEKILAKKME
ncbi:competence protein ComGF [Gracilibacillus alcaliphilus]|nr:competence protein ComGF [Gracilibacillus alcaliphilus]